MPKYTELTREETFAVLEATPFDIKTRSAAPTRAHMQSKRIMFLCGLLILIPSIAGLVSMAYYGFCYCPDVDVYDTVFRQCMESGEHVMQECMRIARESIR